MAVRAAQSTRDSSSFAEGNRNDPPNEAQYRFASSQVTGAGATPRCQVRLVWASTMTSTPAGEVETWKRGAV